MSAYSDDEQLEALKKWWDENGNQLLVSVVVALAVVFGFRAWQGDVKAKGEAASALYQDLMDGTTTGTFADELDEDAKSTSRYIAESLKKDHEDSTYAAFAAFYMAKLAVSEGDLTRAEEELRWVLDHGAGEPVELTARVRLARLLSERGDDEGALALLDEDSEGFRALLEETKGDIYHKLGRREEARTAYRIALDNLAQEGANPVLQMKLDELAPPQGYAAEEGGSSASAGAGEEPADAGEEGDG